MGTVPRTSLLVIYTFQNSVWVLTISLENAPEKDKYPIYVSYKLKDLRLRKKVILVKQAIRISHQEVTEWLIVKQNQSFHLEFSLDFQQ